MNFRHSGKVIRSTKNSSRNFFLHGVYMRGKFLRSTEPHLWTHYTCLSFVPSLSPDAFGIRSHGNTHVKVGFKELFFNFQLKFKEGDRGQCQIVLFCCSELLQSLLKEAIWRLVKTDHPWANDHSLQSFVGLFFKLFLKFVYCTFLFHFSHGICQKTFIHFDWENLNVFL